MKVYLYDLKTGVYEGETFEEAAMLQHGEGLTVSPPPDCGHGQVPVFDRQNDAWTVIPVTVARQLLNIGPSSPGESKL